MHKNDTTVSVRYWRALVEANVKLRRLEDADAIAARCHLGRLYGSLNFSVWHQAAGFYGTECQCAPCRRESGARPLACDHVISIRETLT